MLKNVVFPAPFGPIRETIEPVGIVKFTSLFATSPPNTLPTLSATRRSVVATVPIRVAALGRDVVQRRVGDAELVLLLMPPLGDQPSRAEEHHQHDDQAVDPELVLGRVEALEQREVRLLELGADLGEALDVEIAEDHP